MAKVLCVVHDTPIDGQPGTEPGLRGYLEARGHTLVTASDDDAGFERELADADAVVGSPLRPPRPPAGRIEAVFPVSAWATVSLPVPLTVRSWNCRKTATALPSGGRRLAPNRA